MCQTEGTFKDDLIIEWIVLSLSSIEGKLSLLVESYEGEPT